MLSKIKKIYDSSKTKLSNIIPLKNSGLSSITVNENKKTGTKIMMRDEKVLSGINLKTLKPTSWLYRYPHLIELTTTSPKNVLCLGGGACAYPTYLIKNQMDVSVVAIEKDEKVIKTAREHFPLPDDGFRLIEADGYSWMANNDSAYDLIFADIGIVFTNEAESKNTNFLSKNSLRLYKKSLSPKGILFINTITTLNDDDLKLTKEWLKKFKQAFVSSFAFKVTPSAGKNDLQDLLFMFSNKNITLEGMSKSLKKAAEGELSYPKEDYSEMLGSVYKID